MMRCVEGSRWREFGGKAQKQDNLKEHSGESWQEGILFSDMEQHIERRDQNGSRSTRWYPGVYDDKAALPPFFFVTLSQAF